MISCKYVGTFQDYSGYGNANRADITALFAAGVNTTTELVVQVAEKTNYGVEESIALHLKERPIEYKVKIIHLTPDMYPRYMEPGRYNIGRLFWETNQLPAAWVGPCNQMAEIWTGSERMVKMIRDSGVKVPIYCFPEPIDTMEGEELVSPFEMKYKKDFIFYSIFQWIERKNAKTLLRAYWKAFSGNNDVTLLLKTYRVNYSPDEFAHIKKEINEWKSEMGLSHYSKIFLTQKLLTDRDMKKLHVLGDCYINASSGEGWCRPVQEAMLHNKLVISADNGGITDFMNEDYYVKVPSIAQKVTEVSWIPWYTKDQHWWEIKEEELSDAMKDVFERRGMFANQVNRAKRFVMDYCSYQTVGNQMKERIANIERIL